MLDPKLIRTQLHHVADRLACRGYALDVSRIALLESRRKHVQVRTEQQQAERALRSASIALDKSKGADSASLTTDFKRLAAELDAGKSELAAILAELQDIYLSIPNLPDVNRPGFRGGRFV